MCVLLYLLTYLLTYLLCCPALQSLGRLGSPVVRMLHSRLDGRELDSRPRLRVGWVRVTVFGRANRRIMSPSYPGQLSLLPSVGREMSTGQSAVTLCGWEVKAGMVLSPLVDKRVGGR